MPIIRGKVCAALLAYGFCLVLGLKGVMNILDQLRNIVFHVDVFMLSKLIDGIIQIGLCFLMTGILLFILYWDDKLEEKEKQKLGQ
jgi:hypothetical protein